MTEAYIVDAVRTPIGKKKGGLADVHPADLGAHVIKALVDRTGIDPADVDDVVFGCVDAIGGQAGNIARTAWLAAGYPQHVPGVTVDRQCGSSQQALHFGAQAILSNTADLIVAGGVQNMTQIPISAAMIVGQQYGFDTPFGGSKGWTERYGDEEVSQFKGAEMIAEKWDISREELEKWALQSHERAKAAIAEGRFDNEIVPLGDATVDEGPRETSLEKMASLQPLVEGGRLTAAVASQISDGASAVLLASDEAVKKYGLKPRARIHHLSARGDDPIFMLTAPIPATQYALEKAGLTIDDIDLIEINEAFAAVAVQSMKDLGVSTEKVNVNGGAIALGHPIGMSGARLVLHLALELKRRGGGVGAAALCGGGGQGDALIVRVPRA